MRVPATWVWSPTSSFGAEEGCRSGECTDSRCWNTHGAPVNPKGLGGCTNPFAWRGEYGPSIRLGDQSPDRRIQVHPLAGRLRVDPAELSLQGLLLPRRGKKQEGPVSLPARARPSPAVPPRRTQPR